ncbi:PASTA domain-containing protein [Streptomyces sp. NPDC093568]|uniref:PASTA domain-containing protein n=1 Tax=Streptomyces sp. NPDC093568 TaxID=3366041 RepID=UPI00382E9B55
MVYAQNLVLGLVLGQRAGLSTKDSLQPAIVAGVVPNPLLGIVVADQLIKRQLAAGRDQEDVPAATGTNTVVVPDLLSLSPSRAREELAQAGLTAAAQDRLVVEDKVPRGQVAAQSPVAKTVVARGSEVLLFVSRGKSVPKVVGLHRGEAVETLIEAGFGAEIVEVPGDKDDRDRVRTQDPEPGGFPETGRTVRLEVSMGIPAIVPDVRLMTRREAGRNLAKSLLEPVYEDRDCTETDVVVAQDPKAGEVVAQKSAVLLRLRTRGTPEHDTDKRSRRSAPGAAS